ncbi:hypothetical protein X729_32115 [Mesorhizobium sp. L103C131B0]|nr:hypothetical protein X729_32115 [Mesorhizobium sp. L103C131B0]
MGLFRQQVKPGGITAQLGSASFRQGHSFRRTRTFQLLCSFAQIGLEGENAKAGEDSLDAIADPRIRIRLLRSRF